MFKYVLHYPITDDTGNRTEHSYCYAASERISDESKLYSYLLGSLSDSDGINLAGEDWPNQNATEIAEILKDKVRIEFVIDWENNDTALHWIDNYPTHSMTRNLAAHYFGLAYPEGEQTREGIKKFYDDNIANLRPRKHKIPPQSAANIPLRARPTAVPEEMTTFEIDVSQRTYGQCSYTGDETWSGDVQLAVRRIRRIIADADGDEDEINNYLEDALKDAWQNDNNIENGEMDYTYEEYSENDCDSPSLDGRYINAFVAGLIREYEEERDARNAEEEEADNEENEDLALDVGAPTPPQPTIVHPQIGDDHPQLTVEMLNQLREAVFEDDADDDDDDAPNQTTTATTADTVTITNNGHNEQWITQPYPETTSPATLANADHDDAPLTEGMADQIREITNILNEDREIVSALNNDELQAPTQNTNPIPF